MRNEDSVLVPELVIPIALPNKVFWLLPGPAAPEKDRSLEDLVFFCSFIYCKWESIPPRRPQKLAAHNNFDYVTYSYGKIIN